MKKWMYKQASQANCSPALGVLGLLVAAVITIYIYHNVIINTLIDAGIAVGIVCGAIITVAFTVRTIRWQRRRNQAAVDRAIAEPIPAPAVSTHSSEEEITAEADWLASGVELAFSPDGKTLKAKTASKIKVTGKD